MNPEQELEKYIDRELRDLPTPPAPATLVGRVMMAVQSPSVRPWYQQSWFEWPRPCQCLSAAMAVALLVTLLVVVPGHLAGVQQGLVTQLHDNLGGWLDELVARFNHVLDLVVRLWLVLFQPVLIYLLPVAALMVLCCVALGSAMTRLVWKEIQA